MSNHRQNHFVCQQKSVNAQIQNQPIFSAFCVSRPKINQMSNNGLSTDSSSCLTPKRTIFFSRFFQLRTGQGILNRYCNLQQYGNVVCAQYCEHIRSHTFTLSTTPAPPPHNDTYGTQYIPHVSIIEPQLLYVLLCPFPYSLPIPVVYGIHPHINSYIHFLPIHSHVCFHTIVCSNLSLHGSA